MRLKSFARKIKKKLTGQSTRLVMKEYQKRFEREAFEDCQCSSAEQFEASITRLYHTIEKGLSYQQYRPGFGKNNVEKLLVSLEQYASEGFDTTAFFYETALSCLVEYVRKNSEFGVDDAELLQRIKQLTGKPNTCGGSIMVSAPQNPEMLTYEQLILTRHSIRHFSHMPVDVEMIKECIRLAQHTPSACNRQCWRTRIIINKRKIEVILANQNGNRGFGQEIDKLLIITADLRAQQKSRELFQAYIDGGMYAENVLNALFSKGIGSIPLSASLTRTQEMNVRRAAYIGDSEVLILFIGVGNYPDGELLTTRSERKHAEIEVVS